MKKILLALCLLLSCTDFAPDIARADAILAAGATSQCLDVFVSDSSSTVGAGLTGLAFNTGSLTCYYHRRGASSATSITLQTSTLGTYTSGAFKEVSASNAPGLIEFCPPDAALAAGASDVTFECKGAANMVPMVLRVLLSPSINIASASAGSIGEAAFSARNTAQAVTSSTIQLASAESFADSELNNNTAVHIVSATTGAGQTRCIKTYVGSTDTATLLENWTTTPTGTITYNLIPAPHCDALEPTTAGRTLLVNATGGVAIDWGNVQNPSSSVNLSGTTVPTAASTSRKW